MREERLFHFQRRNIFPTTDDDVLLSIDDKKVTVFVPDRHVTCMKPASSQSLGRGLRLLPVALHDTIAAGENLSDGAPVARNILSVRVYDAQFHAGDGVTGHRLSYKALLTLPRDSILHASDGQYQHPPC